MEEEARGTNQLELKDVGAVLSLGTGLHGGVLVAQERIVVHGEAVSIDPN